MNHLSAAKFDKENIHDLLNAIYSKSINGIPNVSSSIEKMANDYLQKYPNKERACKVMLKNQVIKCTTSGAITGFGGILTIPITLPANISSVLYIQVRMVSCLAYMLGFDITNDEVQTFIYACIFNISVENIVKQLCIKVTEKCANSIIKKIPGKTLTKINQKIGFRFITKFGNKGIINMGKLVPAVGSVIGGAFDFTETKLIAHRAYKWFVENDYSEDVVNDKKKDIEIAEKE